MKFRQLLALCYHYYLVSDQDFRKCCDEVAIFKIECTCLPEMIVLQCLRHRRYGYNCNRLFSYASFTFQNVFFLDVRFGFGSSTKIKTADIQRKMCATVVTFKKKSIGRGKISFERYARADDRNKFA